MAYISTTGVYDATQSKAQNTINSEVASALANTLTLTFVKTDDTEETYDFVIADNA